MAKIPSFQRIRKEDYSPDERDFVERLAFPLNKGFDTLYSILGGDFTLQDNAKVSLNEITLQVNDLGFPTSPVQYTLSKPFTLIGTQVIAADSVGKVDYPTSQPFISFSQTGQNVRINKISGLPAGTVFKLRIFNFGL